MAVIIGGTLGHGLCTGLAVVGGRLIAQKISVRTGKLPFDFLFKIFIFLFIWFLNTLHIFKEILKDKTKRKRSSNQSRDERKTKLLLQKRGSESGNEARKFVLLLECFHL